MEIVINVSLSFAIMSVIQFYIQLKGHLKHHKPLAKLLAFKLLVALTFVQSVSTFKVAYHSPDTNSSQILFWILRSTKVLSPNAKFTWSDVNMGIPTMIVCIEMVAFAVFYWYAYDFRPYLLSTSRPLASGTEDDETAYLGKDMARDSKHQFLEQSYQGGFLGWRAWVHLIIPIDVIRGIGFAFSMASQLKRDPTAPTYRENY